MAWTTLDLNNLLAGEPLIEAEVLALYENPIAIAEGAPGAPRVVPKALAYSFFPYVEASGSTIIEYSDLDPLTFVFFDIYTVPSGTSSRFHQLRVSSDGGNTFSAWFEPMGRVDQNRNHNLFYFDLTTGLVEIYRIANGGESRFKVELQLGLGGDTGVQNINTIQFRISGSGPSQNIVGWVMSRVQGA